jgi:hypothetical protein
MDAEGIGPFCPNGNCDVFDNLLGVAWTIEPDPRDADTRATIEAEIVAWLRSLEYFPLLQGMEDGPREAIAVISNAIERGEHREKR